MERAGLGYAVLAAENPRLVYAQLTGFGPDGPYRDKGGLDLIAQGMGGLMHVTGEPDGPPTSVGQPICDLGTGMWGVQGILAALYERERTGPRPEGRLLAPRDRARLLRVDQRRLAGRTAGSRARQGARHRQNAPYQRFATQDGYMMIGAATQDLWERCRPGARPGRVDRRIRASGGTPTACGTARRSRRRSRACSGPSRRPTGSLPSTPRACRPVPSTPTPDLFADPQVRHLGMVVARGRPGARARAPRADAGAPVAEPGGGADASRRGSARTPPRSCGGLGYSPGRAWTRSDATASI